MTLVRASAETDWSGDGSASLVKDIQDLAASLAMYCVGLVTLQAAAGVGKVALFGLTTPWARLTKSEMPTIIVTTEVKLRS